MDDHQTLREKVLFQGKDAHIDQTYVDEEPAFLKMARKAGFVKPAGLNRKMWMILKPLM